MQTSEEFQTLLSAISHEIRNPVTLINSYLQLMAQTHPEICEYPYWDTVQQEMTHLRALLEDISSYQNVYRLHTTETDMTACLREYAGAVAPVLSQNTSVTFCTEISGDLPVLSVDPVRLRQILDNLLRNAVDAIMQASQDADSLETGSFSGSVMLSAFVHEDMLHISVSDNGCGIQKEHLATLFNPFVTHKDNGTGLGLAISRRIAEAHGGTLICLSCAKPTVFEVQLPVKSRQ